MSTTLAAESFRDLLLLHRGRTGLTQRQLAGRLGAGRRTVQDWEAGVTYPNAEGLRALIAALFEAGGLTVGREAAEAQTLWSAARREAPRMHTPFDAAWFASLLVARSALPPTPNGDVPRAGPAAPPGAGGGERGQDWGEAPDTAAFIGRTDELLTVKRWVLDERCRVVAILGMGGIGKTMLTAKLAQEVAPRFECVYWRSLRDAPPVGDWLSGAIGFLSDQQRASPASEAERLTTLLGLLRERRCLLVLDNLETLFEPGHSEGRYRAHLAGYGRLLQAVGEAAHQSCLVLTSREAPPELAALGGESVRTFELRGLETDETEVLLAPKQLAGTGQQWAELNTRFSGNGLALKVIGESIRELFGGNIGSFLGEAGASSVFGGIRRLLAEQVERSSVAERQVLHVLAVVREPMTLSELLATLGPRFGRGAVVEAVEALRRRSLIEPAETRGAAAFTLQSVVLEYVTEHLVEAVANEIERGQPALLVEQPLIRAQAKDYVRQTQERLIGEAIVQRLRPHGGAEARLLGLLDAWRDRPPEQQGYGPGTVVNLLRLLRGHLRGLDLSHLALRQAYLAQVDAQDASLAGAHLAETVLAEAFDFPGSVTLSGDGALLAVGTSTGQVYLWRVADRTLLWTAQGHSGMAGGVALSADGQRLASGGDDGTVRVWETSTGRPLVSLQAHSGMVGGVALSANGHVLASSSFDGTVRLWEASTGRPLATLKGHSGAVYGVALPADGQLLASGGFDGTVRVWASSTGQPLAPLAGHAGPVWGVALSADGQLLASGGEDGTVRLWEASTGRPLAILQGQTGRVHSVALSTDGQLLASGAADGTVRLWEAGTGRALATLQGHTGPVWGVALSADGQLLASGGEDGTVRLWEGSSGRPLAILQGQTGAIRSVALSADGQLLASGVADGTVRLWAPALAGTGSVGRSEAAPASAPAWQLVATLQGHTTGVRGVALSADGRLLASGSADRAVRLWDAERGRLLATLGDGAGGPVSLSADGRLLAVRGARDGTLELWDTRTARLLATWQGHPDAVWSIALSADGHILASGGADGTLRVWEVPSGRHLGTWHVSPSGVSGVALSADGQLLASTNNDGTLPLWAIGSAQPVAVLHGHTSGILGVALAADGRLLASGDCEGIVRLWDAKARASLATLRGHSAPVWSVALSADGHLLASASWDGTVRLWATSTGTALCTLRPERRYECLDITGLEGITAAQRAALLALGARERA